MADRLAATAAAFALAAVAPAMAALAIACALLDVDEEALWLPL